MASCQERGKQPEKQLLAADTDEETDGEDFEAVRENKTLQEDSNGEDVDDETSSSGYNSAEEERVRKELQQIPFEVLERLRETDNSAALAVTTVKATRRGDGNDTSLSKKFKRENKNRPPEMSSKRPVPRFREVFEAPKREIRDPRFESLSGKFDKQVFRKRYSFLYEEQLPEEASKLKSLIRKEKDPGAQQKLHAKLTRVQQQIAEEAKLRKKDAWESERKAKEKELVKAGKKPFYLKRSEQRKAELVRKYHELKDAGRLDKFMEKKRRRNAAKEHRLLPAERRG
mmetsp:Transcript_15116/g.36028  ORF Transcript_15116/g.36028 Transcript_15116/m.36028 type:complete len:286 (-) Transcript_15116:27-884(-)